MSIKRKLHYFEFRIAVEGVEGGKEIEQHKEKLYAKSEHGARKEIFAKYGKSIVYIEMLKHEVKDVVIDMEYFIEIANKQLKEKT